MKKAIVTNDVATLDFATIRYGQSENLYGYKEIEAFRAARADGVTGPNPRAQFPPFRHLVG